MCGGGRFDSNTVRERMVNGDEEILDFGFWIEEGLTRRHGGRKKEKEKKRKRAAVRLGGGERLC
jgi:hypothetical protein